MLFFPYTRLFLSSEVIAHSTPVREHTKVMPGGSSAESTDTGSVSSCELSPSENEDASSPAEGTSTEPQNKVHCWQHK